ncbi:putative phage holin protein [Escherichia coli]|nr:putative phage holin protein [Escherichia coli]
MPTPDSVSRYSGRRAGSGDAGAGEEETENDSVVGGVAVSTIQTGITEQVIAWLFDHLPTVYAVGAAVSISRADESL